MTFDSWRTVYRASVSGQENRQCLDARSCAGPGSRS